MSFVGVVLACWLAIAAVAFVAFSGLARLAARTDTEADLGIVGDAELSMILGDRGEGRFIFEPGLRRLGATSMSRIEG